MCDTTMTGFYGNNTNTEDTPSMETGNIEQTLRSI